MGLQVNFSGQSCGAEITGIDLKKNLSDNQISEIRELWLEYHVLSFPNQSLTDDDLERFTLYFGSFGDDPFINSIPGRENIIAVKRTADEKVPVFADNWHTDWSFQLNPPAGTCLFGKIIPTEGGDTLFASTVLAYEGLSEAMKQTLERLSAVHSSRHVFGVRPEMPGEMSSRIGNQEAALQDAVHPVVIRHPLSGKKSLYVNPGFTLRFDGWTAEESEPLLKFLYGHITRPEYTYRHKWGEGSMAFWDNRATWHFAINDYHGEKRLMHRITLEGEPLRAAAD